MDIPNDLADAAFFRELADEMKQQQADENITKILRNKNYDN